MNAPAGTAINATLNQIVMLRLVWSSKHILLVPCALWWQIFILCSLGFHSAHWSNSLCIWQAAVHFHWPNQHKRGKRSEGTHHGYFEIKSHFWGGWCYCHFAKEANCPPGVPLVFTWHSDTFNSMAVAVSCSWQDILPSIPYHQFYLFHLSVSKAHIVIKALILWNFRLMASGFIISVTVHGIPAQSTCIAQIYLHCMLKCMDMIIVLLTENESSSMEHISTCALVHHTLFVLFVSSCNLFCLYCEVLHLYLSIFLQWI